MTNEVSVHKRKIANILKRRFVRCLGDDRGVVMYYTAIFACFILALSSLTFDVAKVSEDKMQMQHAADSAALEMAAWQARGMNMTQHLNDEIYDIDKLILLAYTSVAAATAIGIPLRALWGIGYIIEGVAAPIAYIARFVRLTTVVLFLKPIRFVYANGSVVMGYIAANNAAIANKADPIIPATLVNPGSGGIPGFIAKLLKPMLKNFAAAGVPTSTDMLVMLPLESKETQNLPLNSKKFKAVINIMLKNTFIYPKSADFWHWNDKYYRSKSKFDNKELPPMVWFCKKDKTMGILSQYFIGGGSPHKIPIMAYAVGQAKGGNVVKRNPKTHQYRPSGYGTGSDAFLVPFDSISENAAIQALGKLMMH
jgi:hypothetical protein